MSLSQFGIIALFGLLMACQDDARRISLESECDFGCDAGETDPDSTPADGSVNDALPRDVQSRDALPRDAQPRDGALPGDAAPVELDAQVPDAQVPVVCVDCADCQCANGDVRTPAGLCAPEDEIPPGICDCSRVCDDIIEDGCAIEIELEGRPPLDCRIPPNLDFACGYYARCLCDAQFDTQAEIERCASWMLVPRGAITLADFCGQADLNMAELASMASETVLQVPEGSLELKIDPECETIPAVANPEASNWGMEICSENVERDPHVIESMEIDGQALAVEFTAPQLCGNQTAFLCWDGELGPGPSVPFKLHYFDRPGPCEPQMVRRVSIAVWPIRDTLAYFNPQHDGPLPLTMSPWYRDPEQACERWGAAEPCVEDSCDWTGEACVDPVIEVQFDPRPGP